MESPGSASEKKSAKTNKQAKINPSKTLFSKRKIACAKAAF